MGPRTPRAPERLAPSRRGPRPGPGLPRGTAGGERAPAAPPAPCASRGRVSLQKSQVVSGAPSFPGEQSPVQPQAPLRSTPGGSLAPPVPRASFPAPRPHAQVNPQPSLSRARASRVSGAGVRALAAGPASLLTRPRPASAAARLPARPLSLPPTSAPHPSHLRPPPLPESCYF